LRGTVAGRKAAAEAYQRNFHIVKQTWPRGRAGFLTGDENVVDAGHSQKRQKDAGGLPQAAAGAVSDHGAADLLGRGKPLAGGLARRVTFTCLYDEKLAAFGIPPRRVKEFTPDPQALKR